MELCDSGHTEICFEGYNCPMCLAHDRIRELEDDNKQLERQLEDANEEIDNLQNSLDDLEEKP